MNLHKLILFLVVVFFPSYSNCLEINQLSDDSSIKVSNQYFNLILDVSPVPRISIFEANSKSFLKTTSKTGDHQFHGFELTLFNQHPKQATQTIEISEPFTVSQDIKSASEKVIILKSDSTPLAITYQYEFNDYQSKFNIQTQIKNTSDHPIEFFPTELGTWNTEVGSTGMPNMNFYVNVPLLESTDASYKVIQGSNNANEIIHDATHHMFYFRYKAMLNEIEISNDNSWYAVLNGSYTQPQVVSIEHFISGDQLESVENNFHFFSNGAGTVQKNGKTIKQDFNVEKFLATRNVIGKITLEPNEEFNFRTLVSATVCPGPIVQVDEGLVYNKPIFVETYDNTYLIFGILGIPQEGLVAIEMLDENGEILERHTALSLMLDYFNQANQRPGNVVTHLPTVFYHQIGFGLDVEDDEIVDYSEKVMTNTKTIKVYLTDYDRNNLILLGETEAPYDEFVIPEEAVINEEINQTN